MSQPPVSPRPTSELKELASSLLLYAEARGRLLQIEASEAGSKVGGVAVSGILAVVGLILAWVLAMPALVWMLAERVGWHWSRVALAAAGAHLLIGLLFFTVVRVRLKRLRLFEASLAELRKDREWIQPVPQP